MTSSRRIALSALYTGSARRALACLCSRDPFASDWSVWMETTTALEGLERRAERLEGFKPIA